MNEVQSQALMIEKLRHQLFGLRKDKFGSSGEGLDQLGLKLEDEETGQEQTAASLETTDDVAPPKTKPVRRSLPEHLPRTDITFVPHEPCAGCGRELDDSAKTLGEDVMEELEYVPGRFVVNRICRPRVSCPACEAITHAPMPSRPIPKSYAGPGLLASIIVGKYADHLPLYRQSQILGNTPIF
jgi:transposase